MTLSRAAFNRSLIIESRLIEGIAVGVEVGSLVGWLAGNGLGFGVRRTPSGRGEDGVGVVVG